MSKGGAKYLPEKAIFATRLGVTLSNRGLERTPQALSKVTGISVREAEYYVKGVRLPGAVNVGRIEVALGVSAAWLVGLDSPEAPPGWPQGGTEPPQAPGTPPEDWRPRSGQGVLLRHLVSWSPQVRVLVEGGSTTYAPMFALVARLAAKMISDRVSAIFKHTFEENEIADTRAGRVFTIAFLERTAREFRALGLEVSDMWEYAADLRKLNDDERRGN